MKLVTESVQDILKSKSKVEIDSAIQKKFQNSEPNEILGYALSRGNLYLVKYALSKRADPAYMDNWLIKWAAENGYIELVKQLLADFRVDPSDSNNAAILWAAYHEHVEIVNLLLTDSRVLKKLTAKDKNN